MQASARGWIQALSVLGVVALFGGFAGCGAASEESEENEQLVNGCGVERWSVKTGTDPDVSKVGATAQDTTIQSLVSFAPPSSPPANGRVAPQEETIYALRNVTLIGYKSEADGDFHLLVSDGTHGMNVEIPSPNCVGASSPFSAGIKASRTAFSARHAVSGSLTHVNETISVMGVGFFDKSHGQTGGAPNAFELHPVIDICFGQNCTLAGGPPHTDAGAPDSGGHDAGGHDSGNADSGNADSGNHDSGGGDAAHGGNAIQNVFIILMENHNWSQIKGSSSAPYLNNTVLPMAAYAENYGNPPGNHPSEPNYIWLEAGDNLGVTNDSPPSTNHQSTTSHLSTLLTAAGVSWRSYAEGISGTSCPLTASGLYAPKHVPFVFFDDVTNNNSSTSATCIQHVRPYTELARDLQNNSTARYNFIVPNLCNDSHNSTGCATTDAVRNGDTWLSAEVPKIMASAAYQNGGAIFITWDESEGGDVPIGMIVLSPHGKGGGYSNRVAYTHSSTLRTMQTIFGVGPFLRGAASATDLSDLFATFP